MRQQINGRWFQWDDKKAKINKRKHGISFKTATLVFEDDGRIEYRDDKHSDEEDRWITVRMVNDILTVVYTERGEDIRLISARPANDEERSEYDDNNPILFT